MVICYGSPRKLIKNPITFSPESYCCFWQVCYPLRKCLFQAGYFKYLWPYVLKFSTPCIYMSFISSLSCFLNLRTCFSFNQENSEPLFLIIFSAPFFWFFHFRTYSRPILDHSCYTTPESIISYFHQSKSIISLFFAGSIQSIRSRY